MRGRWLTVLAGSIAAVALGLVTASAAQLTITAGGTSGYSALACTGVSIPVGPPGGTGGSSLTQVQLSSVPATCNGLPVVFTLINSSGTSLASGSGTAATGTTLLSLSSGTYDSTLVASIQVLIGTWAVPTTWSGGTAGVPTLSCTAINPAGNPTGQSCTVSYSWSVVAYNPYPTVTAIGINFTVTTGANNWRIRIDFADPAAPWAGFLPTTVWTNGNPSPGSCAGYVLTAYKYQPWNTNSGYIQARTQGTYGTQLCP